MLEPKDVFTPRVPYSENPEMYVVRTDLENSLKDILKENLHIIVHGDSGTGKSWLCYKLLDEYKKEFSVYVLRFDEMENGEKPSVIDVLLAYLPETYEQTGYSEKKKAAADIGILSGEGEHEKNYTKVSRIKDSYFEFLEYAKKESHGKKIIIMIDNFETIIKDSQRVKELANILIKVDDPKYAPFKAKFLIIGTPNNLRDYFAKINISLPIAQRLREIPVSRLTRSETDEIVKRGFVEKLKFPLSKTKLSEIQEQVYWITAGVPSFIHFYCLELAKNGFKELSIMPEHVKKSNQVFMASMLSESYQVLQGAMNAIGIAKSRIGWKNVSSQNLVVR